MKCQNTMWTSLTHCNVESSCPRYEASLDAACDPAPINVMPHPPTSGDVGTRWGFVTANQTFPPHMGHFLQSQTPNLPRICPTPTADFCEDCDRCPFLCIRSLDKRPTYPHPWGPAHVTIALSFPNIRPRWG